MRDTDMLGQSGQSRSIVRARLQVLTVIAALAVAGCAGLPQSDPIQVTMAGVEALPGEGLEARMLVKLRVQNPNDAPIEYDGVYVKLDVLDKTFATGVSDTAGTVPRFGETVIDVPVSVSMIRIVRQVAGMLDGRPADKVTYKMSGKLHGTMLRTVRFESHGEFTLPVPSSAK
jgi:LEA14-like dessication related protein